MTTYTINATSIKFSDVGGIDPQYDAPLPKTFDTGHPIYPEPGIWTVYTWLQSECRWAGLMSTNMRESACQLVTDLVGDLEAKGVPAAYRVEEGT